MWIILIGAFATSTLAFATEATDPNPPLPRLPWETEETDDGFPAQMTKEEFEKLKAEMAADKKEREEQQAERPEQAEQVPEQPNGDEPMPKLRAVTVMLNCPDGYDFTGEYRPPKSAEWYLDCLGNVRHAQYDCLDYGFILKPVPKPDETLETLMELRDQYVPSSRFHSALQRAVDARAAALKSAGH